MRHDEVEGAITRRNRVHRGQREMHASGHRFRRRALYRRVKNRQREVDSEDLPPGAGERKGVTAGAAPYVEKPARAALPFALREVHEGRVGRRLGEALHHSRGAPGRAGQGIVDRHAAESITRGPAGRFRGAIESRAGCACATTDRPDRAILGPWPSPRQRWARIRSPEDSMSITEQTTITDIAREV